MLSPGFWLSFGAVASIFYVMSLRAGKRGQLARLAGEQLAVTVAMLPMLLALFQEFSLVSPLANALAIPVVSLVVVPLAIAGAFLPLPWLLDLAHATDAGADVAAGARSPIFRSPRWRAMRPRRGRVVAGIVGCAWLLAPRGVPMRSLGVVWVAPLFAVAPPVPRRARRGSTCSMSATGSRWSCARRATRSLFDAGPGWNADADSGSRIVVPFLRGEGIRTLDGMVVSHADDDHSGGAISVAGVARAAVAPLVAARRGRDPPRVRALVALRGGPALDVGRRGVRDAASRGRDVRGDRRAARRTIAAACSRSRRAARRRCSPGDVEARAEAEMLSRDARPRCAPRCWWSRTTARGRRRRRPSSPRSRPKSAIFSVGYRNRFGHPHPAVVARYAAARALDLRRTDREGALHVELPRDRRRGRGRMLETDATGPTMNRRIFLMRAGFAAWRRWR